MSRFPGSRRSAQVLFEIPRSNSETDEYCRPREPAAVAAPRSCVIHELVVGQYALGATLDITERLDRPHLMA